MSVSACFPVREMTAAPRQCQLRHLRERACLLEQVGGAGNDFEFDMRPMHVVHDKTIELDHRMVGSSDDEQSRRVYLCQRVASKVGPSSA